MKYVKDTSPRRANIDTLPARRRGNFLSIKDELFWEFFEKASPFSLVHVAGFYNVFQSMHYIHRNKLAGDIVECGCYLGGVGIFMALMRDHLELSKTIYLYDSFEGFPSGEEDIARGKPTKAPRFPNILKDVKDNFAAVIPNLKGVEFIQGFVENTLPRADIRAMCLLRLDTDFYNSTKAELNYLYPALVKGGVLIVDDYGWFEGARRATDEYFAKISDPPLLNRIDEGVWAGVKP
jgi:O-methyltransferase